MKKKQEKLVSVLIPIYNVEKFVKLAIDDILSQSYKNLEIIIVDDCSTDSTFEILKLLSLKDSRIKLFRNDKNLKICKSLNRAFLLSNGDYIVRMDGDDRCDIQRIEKQIDFLEENKDIDLVGVSIIGIDEEGKEISRKEFPENFSILKLLLNYGTPVLHIWAARRSVYEKLKGYRDILYVEDYDFLTRMVSQGLKFSNLKKYYGYSVRYREGNTVSTNGIEQIKAFDYTKQLYKERKRLKSIVDSYNREKFEKILQVTNRESEDFIYSLSILEKYIKNKKKIYIIYIIQSILSSKYQFKRIFNVGLFNFIRKIGGKI